MTMFGSRPPANLAAREDDTATRIVALEIDQVAHETEDAISLTFTVPEHLATQFSYEAGQFLTLEIPCSDEGSLARCYSFSSSRSAIPSRPSPSSGSRTDSRHSGCTRTQFAG